MKYLQEFFISAEFIWADYRYSSQFSLYRPAKGHHNRIYLEFPLICSELAHYQLPETIPPLFSKALRLELAT